MAIAALQAQNLSLTSLQSDVEYQLQLVNGRRQILSMQSSTLSQEYAKNLQDLIGTDTSSEEDTEVQDDKQEAFEAEYEAAQEKIDALDKMLEMQVKNLEMQQKAVSTQVEGVQKQIQKNAEKEYNTSMG